jgi:hypothetical protein
MLPEQKETFPFVQREVRIPDVVVALSERLHAGGEEGHRLVDVAGDDVSLLLEIADAVIPICTIRADAVKLEPLDLTNELVVLSVVPLTHLPLSRDVGVCDLVSGLIEREGKFRLPICCGRCDDWQGHGRAVVVSWFGMRRWHE